MAHVNLAILVGNAGQGLDQHGSGARLFCSFTMATNESWVDQAGKKQTKTEWHKIKASGKLAETCIKYLTTGKALYVEGKVTYPSWTAQDGTKRSTTEILASKVLFLSEPARHPEHYQGQDPRTYRDQAEGRTFKNRGL